MKAKNTPATVQNAIILGPFLSFSTISSVGSEYVANMKISQYENS